VAASKPAAAGADRGESPESLGLSFAGLAVFGAPERRDASSGWAIFSMKRPQPVLAYCRTGSPLHHGLGG